MSTPCLIRLMAPAGRRELFFFPFLTCFIPFVTCFFPLLTCYISPSLPVKSAATVVYCIVSSLLYCIEDTHPTLCLTRYDLHRTHYIMLTSVSHTCDVCITHLCCCTHTPHAVKHNLHVAATQFDRFHACNACQHLDRDTSYASDQVSKFEAKLELHRSSMCKGQSACMDSTEDSCHDLQIQGMQ